MMEKTNGMHTSVKLLWGLVGALVLACLLLAWQPWARTSQVDQCDEATDIEMAKVVLLHEDQKWAEATRQWEALLARDDLCERQRLEADRHLRNAQAGIDAAAVDDASFTRSADDVRAKPVQPAPEEEFQSYYPMGRKTGSVATFHVNGRGRNKGWVLQGDVYFGYQYQVVSETTVQENNGNFATFLVHFRDVRQLRAISEEQVQLRAPEIESPILKLVWRVTDTALSRSSPVYRVAKTVGRVANWLDPNLERSLTAANEVAKSLGARLADREDVEIAEQVEHLSGKTLQITYVRELGVTQVKVLEGGNLPSDQIQRLAYNSSVLMDYFIYPNADRQPGDTWTVDAHDVAGIVNVDFDVETQGTLRLEHAGTADFHGAQCIELKVVGGEIEATFEGDTGPQTTIVKPKAGSIRFSPTEKLIRGARLEWDMSKIEVSQNHLLYATSNEQEVTVESFYQADRLDTTK